MISWASQLFDKVFVISPKDASPGIANNINLLCDDKESKLIVLEDIDNIDNDYSSDLLNFIDGSVFINRSYFIGTTNHPDKLPENLLSRPSRFDLILEIPRPDIKTRERLLRHYIPNLTNEEYKSYATLSKGLNACYFQEIVYLKHNSEILGRNLTIEQIIKKCKERVSLVKNNKFKKDESISVGFSHSEDDDE